MNSVIELQDDSEFTTHLSEAGSKLVVVDFSASWCGPCTMIAPFFKQLSVQYPAAMFIKVDVDKCPGTAAANNVSAMPTFIFFRNRAILDKIRGANKTDLENKIKQLIQQTVKNYVNTKAIKELSISDINFIVRKVNGIVNVKNILINNVAADLSLDRTYVIKINDVADVTVNFLT